MMMGMNKKKSHLYTKCSLCELIPQDVKTQWQEDNANSDDDTLSTGTGNGASETARHFQHDYGYVCGRRSHTNTQSYQTRITLHCGRTVVCLYDVGAWSLCASA